MVNVNPRICIFSFGRMSDLIKQQIDALNIPADFTIHDVLLDNNFKLNPEMEGADVFLSSGYNAEIIKKQTDKPLINIETSTSDILIALREATKYCDTPIIMTYQKNNLEIEQLKPLLKVDYIQETYADISELKMKVLKHKKLGHKCLIGSSLICDLALENGMSGILVYPRESISQHLKLAYDVCVSLRNEMENNKLLSAITEYSQQGLIVSNRDGKIILCNKKAESIIGMIKSELIGEHLQKAFPAYSLNQADIVTHGAELDQIYWLKNSQVILNTIPIFYKEELTSILFTFHDIREIQKAENRIRESIVKKGFIAKYSFSELSSKSRVFKNTISLAKKYAQSDEIVSIKGETGCGKEVIAQSIHNYSKRAAKAFVAVNCSAISENLLESELFGYVEGSFTGAKKGGKEGLFEMAHEGTILLDEIGDISPPLQAKLLRVIQNKEIMRIGGTRVVPIDTRIICATNKDLWELVCNNTFREDLYYRINVLELEVPPLRERQEDIYPLFMDIVNNYAPQLKTQMLDEHEKINELLTSYEWPGNIRELENCIKKTIIALDNNSNIKDFLLLLAEDLTLKKSRRTNYNYSNYFCYSDNYNEIKKYDDKKAIHDALTKTGGNQTAAAKLLGISRTTLWRKLNV